MWLYFHSHTFSITIPVVVSSSVSNNPIVLLRKDDFPFELV
jgi:hypothetical protein